MTAHATNHPGEQPVSKSDQVKEHTAIPQELTASSLPHQQGVHTPTDLQHRLWVLWMDGQAQGKAGEPCEPPVSLIPGVTVPLALQVMAWQRGWITGHQVKGAPAPDHQE
jgi:hypothetical protein